MTSVNSAPKSTLRSTTTTAGAVPTPATTTTTTATTTAVEAPDAVRGVENLTTDGLDAATDGAGRRTARPALSASSSMATTAPTTTTTTPRRGLQSATTLPEGLSDAARAAITAAVDGSSGEAAQSAVRNLLGNSALRGLSTSSQATLLETLSTSPAESASAATRLLSSSTFRAGTLGVKEQMVDVHAAADVDGRAALVALSADQRLVNRDFTGSGSTLNHLHRLATGDLAAGLDRTALLSSTIGEVADPSTIEQWGQATCVPTSVSLEVARRSPAEYARLVSGLATPNGDVGLRDGQPLQRAADSIASTRSGRSQSERLLQDAFMEFGNGRFAYDVGADANRVTVGGDSVGGGLNIAEAARLQSSVFGERYGSISTRGRVITRDGTQGDLNAANVKDVLDRLTFRRAENAPINRLRDEVGAGRPTLVAMQWSSSGPDAFHAVTVDRIADDRVYFRNPHGGVWHQQPAGSTLSDPPRRFEGGNVESMPLGEFRARLNSVSWAR